MNTLTKYKEGKIFLKHQQDLSVKTALEVPRTIVKGRHCVA